MRSREPNAPTWTEWSDTGSYAADVDRGLLGAAEVTAFLNRQDMGKQVSAQTRNHAPSQLYRHVLGLDLPWLDGVVRAKSTKAVSGDDP